MIFPDANLQILNKIGLYVTIDHPLLKLLQIIFIYNDTEFASENVRHQAKDSAYRNCI